jgi:hypothetical protein
MKCPQCGHEDSFTVTATVDCVLHDDGVDEYCGCEYDGESFCSCNNCGAGGEVGDFREE